MLLHELEARVMKVADQFYELTHLKVLHVRALAPNSRHARRGDNVWSVVGCNLMFSVARRAPFARHYQT